ncbi:IS66 family insertion sequence element accessory protein TnpA [Chitinophaga tropicalis]|uniref:Transposase n=1 Tax=Chitinophaga tropicalis TaxID=2683588 RepID=A0A7K1U5P6_9BACT|nr:transposase [Chitinophaga tropicalis]MVT09670.1 transposase [Chitinophaga tropicalis]
MSNKVKSNAQARYSSEQIISLLDQFDREKINLKAFCADHSICEQTFYNWRKRYLSRKVNNCGNFVEILPTAAEVEIPQGAGGIFAEVRGIRIYQAVSACYLKALVS